MPSAAANTLLLIAMPAEAALLLARMPLLEQSAEYLFRAYAGNGLLLGVTGIGQHNMVAAASRLLRDQPQIRRVINFGCAGAYPSAALPNGSSVIVTRVAKWDLQLPLAEYAGDLAPIELDICQDLLPELPRFACNSGCSFSSAAVRARPAFPQAQLEDMELYGLAALCRAHTLPLIPLKFVSNQVGEHAIEEFRDGFRSHLDSATELLIELLQTGFPDM